MLNPRKSPKTLARVTGWVYLIVIVAGLVAQAGISGRLIHAGDATLTATDIAGNRGLYLLGFSIYMVEMGAQVAMTVLFYELLKPVSARVSRVALALGLIGCGIKTFARVFYIAPLAFVSGSAFDQKQVEAITSVLLQLNDQGAAMGLFFFGIHTLMKGWLLVRASYFPRFLGVLSMLAGAGWVTFISPPLGAKLFPIIALLGFAGAIATILWLIIRGLDEERWPGPLAIDAINR